MPMTYRGSTTAIPMNVAFVSSVPLTAGSRPLSSRSSPFSFRPTHALTISRRGLCQQSTQAHAPRTAPIASLSRSVSVLASLFSLSLFPADIAAASSTLPNSRPQHVEAGVQLSSSSSATINNGKGSVNSPVTLIAPVRAAENSPISNANKPVANQEAAKAPAAATVQQRCSFYLSEFLMWHPGAKVLTLLAFTLAVMYFGSFLYQLADPNQEEASYPFWYVFAIHQHSST